MSTICSPGSLLLQPQRLKRAATIPPDVALLNDFVELISRITMDHVSGGTVVTVLEDGMQALGDRLVQAAGGGIARAQARLQSLLAPVVASLTHLSTALPQAGDPAAVVEALLPLLEQVAAAVAGMTVDHLRTMVGTFLDVLQQDLGLTSAAVEGQVWALFDDLATRVEAVPTEADLSVAANRLAIAGSLRRIKADIQGQFTLPNLNADQLATAIFNDLKGSGFADILGKIACAAKEVGATLTITEDLLHAVPFTGMGSNSVGAAQASPSGGAGPDSGPDEKYLWYASWQLGDNDIGPDVKWSVFSWLNAFIEYFLAKGEGDLFNKDWWVGSDGKVRKNDDIVFQTAEMDWNAQQITFKNVSADAMEGWARHSAYISDFLDALFHIVKLDVTSSPPVSFIPTAQPSHFLGSLSTGLWDIGHGSYQAAASKPLGFGVLHNHMGSGARRLLNSVWAFLSTVLGSLQGKHTKASGGLSARYWAFLLGSDLLGSNGNAPVAGNFWAASLNSMFKQNNLRDFFLSFLTLLNYDGPKEVPDGEDKRPDNRTQIDGIARCFVMLFNYALVKCLPREKYGIQDLTGTQLALWIGGGIGFGILAGFSGVLVCAIIAWAEDWKLLGRNIGKSILLMTAPPSFLVTLYNYAENDTAGGTYNPGGSNPGNQFAGYPSSDASPYLLPWAKGDSIMCMQGNQGFFSHNNVNPTPQVYAYDFGLDQDTEVLASRPGTVVDYFDWVPDEQNVTTSSPSTTLAAAVAPGDTTITVASAAGFPTAGFYAIAVDSEIMTVTGGQGTTTWTVGRGRAGAAAAAHASGNGVAISALGSGQTGSDNWNCVVIRHDQGDDPGNVHDKGVGGNAIVSYGIYGHGRTNSVRTVFAGRQIDPAAIIGTVVKQGQPIMLADSTGNSFCNHCHMEVRPSSSGPPPPPATTLSAAAGAADTTVSVASIAGFPTAFPFVITVDTEHMTVTAAAGTTLTVVRGIGGGGPAAAAPHAAAAKVRQLVPVNRGSLGVTVPFVFKDGDHPKSMDWITSDNARIP